MRPLNRDPNPEGLCETDISRRHPPLIASRTIKISSPSRVAHTKVTESAPARRKTVSSFAQATKRTQDSTARALPALAVVAVALQALEASTCG